MIEIVGDDIDLVRRWARVLRSALEYSTFVDGIRLTRKACRVTFQKAGRSVTVSFTRRRDRGTANVMAKAICDL